MGSGFTRSSERFLWETISKVSLLQSALDLAAQGFHVFPLVPGSKLPAIKDFPNRATRDPEKIRKFWAAEPFNVGISTTRFGEDEALIVIDIDNKGEKKGDDELFKLELGGREFPETFEQHTPTGGRHLIFRTREAVKQGANVLGRGLDVRSRGGYVVGAGSSLPAGVYSASNRDLAWAPEWLRESCGRSVGRKATEGKKLAGVDRVRAVARATEYLKGPAPLALEGDAGDQTTFQVACRVKDQGVDLKTCIELMDEHWNVRCVPPWSREDLTKKVENAYQYGQEAIGVAAPEAQFPDEVAEKETLHPFEKLNEEFAFILVGGGHHILWETKDLNGNFKLEHLNEVSFHRKFASHLISIGDGKTEPVTKLWMRDKRRRSYNGLCFRPGLSCPPNYYNLWRGFAVEPIGDEPIDPRWKQSLDMFLEHAKENVCQGNEELFEWLMGYFAHLIQKPWEKPLTALVFQGKKGVGKNALIERVGHLLGNHFMVTSDRRYLLGNFNGHMENMLLLTLDEAFWSGDKQSEGVLKNLITGKSHVIEHKGKEPYSIENRTRVCVIGNERWLVPATQDERRFAVFAVGEGRFQQTQYFTEMREGMEAGGYRLLLKYFLDFDLSRVNVNVAPRTKALLEQKLSSLEPIEQWWFDCLSQGHISHSEFGEEWPESLPREAIRSAIRRHYKERQIGGRIPTDVLVGKKLKELVSSIEGQRIRVGESRVHGYKFPSLKEARQEWDRQFGPGLEWDT